MLELLSRFVLEVLPPACAVLIAGVLLVGHHRLLFGASSAGPPQGISAGDPIASEEVAQRIEDDHAALETHNQDTAIKPRERQAEPNPQPKRGAWKRPRTPAGSSRAIAPSRAPVTAPSGPPAGTVA